MTVTPNARGRDYIPTSDANLQIFSNNFFVAWNPATFNVVEPLNAALSSAAVAYNIALAALGNPATNTPVNVAVKDDKRASLVALIRMAVRGALAAYKSQFPGATSGALIALGVNPPRLGKTPILAFPFAPLLAVEGSTENRISLRATQVDAVSGAAVTDRRFPLGQASFGLERRVGLVGGFVSLGLRKRVKLVDDTTGIAKGTPVSYRICYQTGSGLASPKSAEVTGYVV